MKIKNEFLDPKNLYFDVLFALMLSLGADIWTNKILAAILDAILIF